MSTYTITQQPLVDLGEQLWVDYYFNFYSDSTQQASFYRLDFIL